MPRLSAAVIIDSDPKGLEALGYGLQVEGCRVTASSDFEAAPALVASASPQLAIVVGREEGPGPLELARTLVVPRDGVAVPVLVLGPETLRAGVKGIAGAGFLPLPAFVRDVATAAKLIIALQGAGMAAGAEDADISGALSDYGLFFLMRTMIGLRRSGIVQLERASRRGEIRFFEGQVTAAQAGSLQGSAALHHLLLWEEAALDLKLRSVVHKGPLHQRSEELLQEAERFLRDFEHASRPIGPTRTVLLANHERTLQPGEAIPAEVVPVVRLFDGQRTLGDVIEDSPFRVFDTIRIVARLLELGMVRRKDAPAEPERRPLLDEWLNAASPAPAARTDSRSSTSKTTRPITGTMRPASGGKDQRVGPLNRRRTHRRERTTEEQALLAREPAMAISGAPAAGEPVAVASPPKGRPTPPLGSRTLASSSLPQSPVIRAAAEEPPTSAHGELRSSTPSAERGAARDAQPPSMVVDMDLNPAPLPSATDPTAPVPAPGAERAAPGKGTAEVAGEVRARSQPAGGAARNGGSIELDPKLMEELVAIEMAGMPATPPPVVNGPAPTPPSRPHAAAPSAPAATVTFPAPAQPDAAPAVAAPVAPAAAPTPTPRVHAGDAPGEPGSASSRSRRGPSSEFDALERDFFDREADLYKEEPHDNLDDLDRRGRS